MAAMPGRMPIDPNCSERNNGKCVVAVRGAMNAIKEFYVKNILKLATIGAALVTTVTVAAAQNTTRGYYDQPSRYWHSGAMTAPSYLDDYGSDMSAGPLPYRGMAYPNFWVSPGSQEERDIGGSGG